MQSAPVISLSFLQTGALIVGVVGGIVTMFAAAMKVANALGATTQEVKGLRDSLPMLLTNAKQELQLEVHHELNTRNTALHQRLDETASQHAALRERVAITESRLADYNKRRSE